MYQIQMSILYSSPSARTPNCHTSNQVRVAKKLMMNLIMYQIHIEIQSCERLTEMTWTQSTANITQLCDVDIDVDIDIDIDIETVNRKYYSR